MAVLGFVASLLMGVILGLMGGGGSILTVPILVYLFGQPAGAATGESLFIVGLTAALGCFFLARRGLVTGRAVLLFAMPSLSSVWLTRKYLLPGIPEQLGSISRDTLLLVLFASLMLSTAVSMLKTQKAVVADSPPFSPYRIVLPALFVGVVTGLVGAGGGFLIVPALSLASHLPMKQAVGTSLAIIAANSLFGFFSDSQGRSLAPWGFLIVVTGLAAIGMTLGMLLSQRVSGEKLRPAFGAFLLVMGGYMVIREVFLPH